MSNPVTETTSASVWQQNWKIVTHNFPSLVVRVDPPGSTELAEPIEDLREEIEDLRDGLRTKFAYQSQGLEGFIPYSVYREQRLLS